MSLNKAVLDIRQRIKVKPSPTDEPAASWTGTDLVDRVQTKTLTVIFRSAGCRWGKAGGCTMCGYVYDCASEPPTLEDYESQLAKAMRKAEKFSEFMVKIFTSGSFLDEQEVPPEARDAILKTLAEDPRVIKVLVETRPNYVTEENVKACLNILKNKPFELAFGLETSSDKIRKDSINKGFTFQDFVRAAETAKKYGITVKAYLMLKPLFLSEKQAMEDITRSIDDAAPYADTISINLCNVQKGTLVETLWEKGQYRPPWLWSIIEILQRAKAAHPDLPLMSDPVGAGSKRGPHNCKECSSEVADSLRTFSLTQNPADLSTTDCGCKELWKKVLEIEDFTYGTPILD
ncbi:histone acetyltransferase, ELP3 family [Methanosarcina horonobensis HB-1 = JCM 15518]|uniref:Histone acetyltransferase, ELP3 family n=1 Tax=Methanosarcina horonobensis HB-1 = JCM 15518 TaxID=1434110 RepID=A0A0E3S5Y2_9EURY|nr:archaeosine biosynthesis radical SAM protein RaSEA [Methanosarcina horonobensis]AKB76594.1 histone acetyltransferase, ELP3 family [Methanosarcina horonobensis HB-1 = JCM 15518]